MEIWKLVLALVCVLASAYADAELLERQKRQNAHWNAMDRSANGGFRGTNDPQLGSGGFGSRLGAGYGGNVWSSGKQSVGLGLAGKADFGLNNGRPYARNPEVGLGATYNRGDNSFSVGAGRVFGSRPSNQFGFSYSRRFRRATDDDSQEKDQFPDDDLQQEEQFTDDDLQESNQDSEEATVHRNRRQAAMNAATANSLSNKPVGQPQFSYNVQGAGNSHRNFGASGSVGAGTKVWERGPHSVGLGVGASGDLARFNGKTYTGNQQLGAGIGYQNGRFSATLGAGRTFGRAPSNHYGMNLGYRFRRSLGDISEDDDDLVNEEEEEENKEEAKDGEEEESVEGVHHRQRRQAMGAATANALSNKGVGRPQFSYNVDAAGRNLRNFGATGSVGAGVKLWERGPHSVGAGVGAAADLNRFNGKTSTGNYQVGAGLGYQHRNGFSATLGAAQGVGQFRSKPVGLLEFRYPIPG